MRVILDVGLYGYAVIFSGGECRWEVPWAIPSRVLRYLDSKLEYTREGCCVRDPGPGEIVFVILLVHVLVNAERRFPGRFPLAFLILGSRAGWVISLAFYYTSNYLNTVVVNVLPGLFRFFWN